MHFSLKHLYKKGSLKNIGKGFCFSIKNVLKEVSIISISNIIVDGVEYSNELVNFELFENNYCNSNSISNESPFIFPLGRTIRVTINSISLSNFQHIIKVPIVAAGFGKLDFIVEDNLCIDEESCSKIPRDELDDFSEIIISKRQNFVEKFSNSKLNHIKQYSFEPHSLLGNNEHFTGIAQVPIGFAGPINVKGEYADGDFIIPLATTEGTLIASYNRGMNIINCCGGVKCTVLDDAMQRAPVFVFSDARGVLDFSNWVKDNEVLIAKQAEMTSKVVRLKYIDIITSHKFAFLRFNYFTGDAAGQNMVNKATLFACEWINSEYKNSKIVNFYLESNLATDKKASQINILHTRGKRVVAEVLLKRDVVLKCMNVDTKKIAYHGLVSNVASFLSGSNNNGLHSANGITAMFIATGQDVANVAESSVGLLYSELTEDNDLYLSITLPSLIVATYGGGTNLATQRECLDILGCYGEGKVNKLAEIVAATVLAGEVSLSVAISSFDWVSSHERMGRNR